MILRTYFVLLACWLYGHSADGMYFKYKLSPNVKELTIGTVPRSENARIPRDVGHWVQRNRKKLVVLDRNNRFVAAFIQKLIKLIKKEENAEKLKSISKSKSNTHKITCVRSFGHLFNSKVKNCEPTSDATKKPILKLMTLKSENVFVDSTRQGSDDELETLTSSDTDSFADTSDYTDNDDFESRARVVQNFRRQGHPLYKVRSDWSDDDSSISVDDVQSGKKKKSNRFAVVDHGKKTKKKPPVETSTNSQSDSDQERVQSENDHDQHVRQEETDSDQEKVLQAHPYSAQKVKAHNTDDDSDIEASDDDEWQPKKQKIKPKFIKKPKPYGELTSLEEEKTIKKKRQSNNYIYLQGPQPVNSGMETDDDGSRRDGTNRLQDFFMPKRNIWDSSEIQHLSYYWYNGPQGHLLYS